MLNISDNKVHHTEDYTQLGSLQQIRWSKWHFSFGKLLTVLLVIFLIFMFLPWTQNVRADGKVTALRPEERPQTIHATIPGRIERWYVAEGQAVKKGDTIVYLSEIKPEYFDPALIERMGNQVTAKENAIASYEGKTRALDDQIDAMQRELESKSKQIQSKIEQAKLKIESDSIKTNQARIDVQIAERQLNGTQALYDKGLKSLTDLEEKRLKVQETRTKLTAAINQLATSRNDLDIYRNELRLVANETANKIAKAQSDRFSTLSEQYDTRATVSKLSIEKENYTRRQLFYYVTAPQDGYIVQAIRPGIGEIIKEGEPVVTIQPANYQLAVEMYVRPLDLPLLQPGQKVRFMFDGWPSFFFSGWPGLSLGTFGGRIVASDRNISANGKFRVLVAPDTTEEAWPQALQPGGGAKGIALLNDVPLWYELWRVLNGFPPDLYKNLEGNTPKQDSKKK